MKLEVNEFIPVVTDKGAVMLYHFADSILFRTGRKLPPKDFEDVRQAMVLKCLEKISEYDQSKDIPLGGYLYWQCRGVISVWANKHKREIPYEIPIVEWLKERNEYR